MTNSQWNGISLCCFESVLYVLTRITWKNYSDRESLMVLKVNTGNVKDILLDNEAKFFSGNISPQK